MVTFSIILGALLIINVLLFKFSVAGGPVAKKPQKRVTPKHKNLSEPLAFNKAS